jgi:hypothetical protein
VKSSRGFLILLGLVAGDASATAAPGPSTRVTGEVVRSQARRVRGGDAIVTESVVRTAAGDVTVRQLGGTVAGVAMLQSHAPPLVTVGDRVELTAAPARDLRGRTTLQIRSVERLVAAPVADRAAPSFVRTLNSVGSPLHWGSDCVFVAYGPGGTADIAGDAERATLDAVFATWREDTASCSYMTFELEGDAESGAVGQDGVNVVRFRDDSWCRPATEDDPEECYDARAAGLTTLWFVNDSGDDRNGQIFDADIELNSATFAFAIDGETTDGSSCVADLANTLTHEVGHLLGLDHTCWGGEGSQPRDGDGELVPPCGGAVPSAARAATMYAFQECGETSKASLEADDINGVCAIYPIAAASGECSRPSLEPAGCCAVAGGRGRELPAGTAWFALGSLAAAVALRRRRAA